jgi:hypothetical protein
LVALTASAAELIGVVAVAEPPGPSPQLAELTERFRTACAETGQGVLEARQLQERMGEKPDASLSELDRTYAGALATYQRSDHEEAIRTLRTVIADLEKLPESPEAFDQWTRAMLRLARAEASLGRKVDSEEILERLVRANPSLKVDPSQYPPSFQQEIDRVRAQLAVLPKRKLEVTSSRTGARVFVELRDIGTAPVTLSVPPGRYRVSGALDGARLPPKMVDLSSQDTTVALDFAVAEALRPSAGPGLAISGKTSDERAREILAAGAWLGLDRIVAGRLVTERGVTSFNAAIYDVRRGVLERQSSTRLDSNNTLVSGASGELARFIIRNEPCLVACSREPVPPPNYKGWGAFASATLSVGLGGFAIYKGVETQGHYAAASKLLTADSRLLVENAAEFRRLRSAGIATERAAYISGAGAIISAAVTGALGYLSYKQTGEVGPFRF